MNLFIDLKVRLSFIAVMVALQVASITIVPKSYSDVLFYLVSILIFAIGFFSLNWRQAVKNISFSTLPPVIIIAFELMITAFMYGDLSRLLKSLETSFALWGVILIVMLPLFLTGFGIRLVTLKLLKMRS